MQAISEERQKHSVKVATDDSLKVPEVAPISSFPSAISVETHLLRSLRSQYFEIMASG